MKRVISLLSMFFFLIPLGAPAEEAPAREERTAEQSLDLGKAAYYDGEWRKARNLFLEALRKDPAKVETVRKYLSLVKTGERTGKRPVHLQSVLKRTMIDEITFEDLTVTNAVKLLNQKIAARHDGKFQPNVIFKDAASDAKLTLSLADIPADEVLRYIVELSGNQAVYEPHAIVISRAEAPKIP